MLNVASAAGLLVIFDTISYTVTKHASIGLTEWLAATYVDQGIGVSVLCPAAVRTPILAGKEDTPEGRAAISTDELADMVVEGFAAATSMTIVTSSQRPAPRFHLRLVHRSLTERIRKRGTSASARLRTGVDIRPRHLPSLDSEKRL